MQSIISIEDITCPITREIFCDPCIASDGNTYEREYITKWLEKNNTSPLTREPMDSKIYSNNLIKRMVDEYLEMYSDEKNNQYKPGVTYMLNRSIIKKSIEENNFDNLIKFTDYDIKDMYNYNIFLKLVQHCKNENVLKHIIDNCIDLECINLECIDYGRWKPIHYICRYSTPNIIKYIIDKNVDLECATNNRWKPIHLICAYSTPEMIKYIIDKNVDLECVNNYKWKPIHYICRYSTPEIIKYIIDKNVDLECTTNNGWKPIHSICRNSTPEMIKYIIDKNVDLECATNHGWKPIHCIAKYSTSKMIKYIISKGVDTKSKIHKYDGEDVDYDCIDLINMRDDINMMTLFKLNVLPFGENCGT